MTKNKADRQCVCNHALINKVQFNCGLNLVYGQYVYMCELD